MINISRSATRSISKVLGIEGGYSNHPSDTGGKTNFGITEDLAREYDYEGDIEDLPLEKAKEIYYLAFWEENNLQEVAKLNESIAYEIFDTAVNCGSEVAGKFFQRCLNAFNKGEDAYEDIKVDGIIGEKTIDAFTDYHSERIVHGKGAEIMQKALNGLQTSYYVRLCEEDDSYENFVYGWINLRVN